MSINSNFEIAFDLRGNVRFSFDDMESACSDYKNQFANGYKPRENYLANKIAAGAEIY